MSKYNVYMNKYVSAPQNEEVPAYAPNDIATIWIGKTAAFKGEMRYIEPLFNIVTNPDVSIYSRMVEVNHMAANKFIHVFENILGIKELLEECDNGVACIKLGDETNVG